MRQIGDDHHVVKAFVEVPVSCGYQARTASRGAAFKAPYEAFEPRVIGCDLAMPRRDGMEVLRYPTYAGCQAGIVIFGGLDRKMVDAGSCLAAAPGLQIAAAVNQPGQTADLRLAFDRLALDRLAFDRLAFDRLGGGTVARG